MPEQKMSRKKTKPLVTQTHFNCPVCLDLLKDPVSVQTDLLPRPVLGKNILLAEMVEKMREEGAEGASVPHYAEPGDEECSVCIGRKRKATMACLECLNSYCESHFKSHEELFLTKKHKTINATGQLQERICGRHNKLLDVFCRSEQQCVCYECALDGHRGHDTISTYIERAEKQKQTNLAITQSIQGKENEIQEISTAMESLMVSAQTLVEQNKSDFTAFINSIMEWCSEVEQCIRGQERAQLSHARRQLSNLEQDIEGLKRRKAELEQLSHTEDDVHFLKNFPSLYNPLDQLSLWLSDGENGVNAIKAYGPRMENHLLNFCKKHLDTVSQKVRRVTLEGLTREDLIQYATRLTLDPNTAYRHFSLSENNTKLSWSNTCCQFDHYDHPQRFVGCRQVFCEQRLYGRCYWEVEWSTRYKTSMAVSYLSIGRKDTDDKNRFGYNDQSWSLDCYPSGYEFRHNNNVTKIQRGCQSSRLAVYVDVEGGTLSYYEVSRSGILTTLHKHKTKFLKPVYVGFFGDAYTYLTICSLK
ncbi:hypothetical protein AALO_G00123290 [Alosa alosa]|uniref:Tripartite motif-containing protein 16-like n=1 Tax=Alosa alosa TaxID=278164 RepID=A0AAV6GPL8_9TELE|nr:tripartite motif-containing protein 16-like isoform X1 [Alosa alosa]KAG5275675.1 hypothetical protein AALO_G00123290 [Alosa alosa]